MKIPIANIISVMLADSIKDGKSGPLKGERCPAILEAVLKPYEEK